MFARLVAALLLGVSALVAVPAPVTAATGPELPEPRGAFPVGTRSLYLKDTTRPDPWKPDKDFRELMVTAWYPTPVPSGDRAPYMSARLSTAVVGKDVLRTVRTHSAADAAALPWRSPLVVLSPGYGMTRRVMTELAEDLAARGYVVAAVDHTYEAAVEFPDGRLEPCLECSGPGDPAVVPSRVKDLRFVLDRLTDPATRLPIDSSRIAVVGHAIGGAAAVDLLSEDPRVDAAVNMDGTFLTPPPAEPVRRPVLLFGAQWPTEGGAPADNWAER
ncbi:alpha/beta hydrolase family protein [Nocardiopsis rhodophaea]|uniref:alpha/beta hydrolase family protein n=1 Tax=Nocardiopsis rhodophaea TaxID=280238 RepID=UPI0031E3067D